MGSVFRDEKPASLILSIRGGLVRYCVDSL